MTSTALFYDIEKKSKNISFRKLILDFFSATYLNSKDKLKDLSTSLEITTADLSDLKTLNKTELKSIYTKAKKYSLYYDRINEKYYSENYFDDAELKGLLRSITRNLHKIENLSFKYLNKDNLVTPTPDHIKETLSTFSKEVITTKIASKI